MLVCSNFVLRPYNDSDAAQLVAIADDPLIAKNMTDRFPHPYTLSAARDWIAYASYEQPVPLNLAIDQHGYLLGGIGLIRGTLERSHSAEVGYWLGRKYWGQGIATEALIQMTKWAFGALGIERVTLQVYEWNPASMRVAEKAGFVFEGLQRRAVKKQGQSVDVRLYAKLKD